MFLVIGGIRSQTQAAGVSFLWTLLETGEELSHLGGTERTAVSPPHREKLLEEGSDL